MKRKREKNHKISLKHCKLRAPGKISNYARNYTLHVPVNKTLRTKHSCEKFHSYFAGTWHKFIKLNVYKPQKKKKQPIPHLGFTFSLAQRVKLTNHTTTFVQ